VSWYKLTQINFIEKQETIMVTKTNNRTAVRSNGRTNPYADALDSIPSVDQRIELMEFSVLMQRTGLKMQTKFQSEGETFDWKAFKAQFQADYGDLSRKEILKELKEKFGLVGEAIREAYKQQSSITRDRVRRSRQAEDAYDDGDDEFDED
jgi:hypothetical protein